MHTCWSRPVLWTTCLLLLVLLVAKDCTGLATSRRRRRPPQASSSSPLSRALRLLYQQGGTLHVLQKCREDVYRYPAVELVQASWQAARGDKEMAAGLVHALLGACCCATENDNKENDNDSKAPRQVCALMRAYDHSSFPLQPNLVALALAYLATNSHAAYQTKAAEFLQRAEQLSGNDNVIPIAAKTNTAVSPTNWSQVEQLYDIRLLQETEDYLVVTKPSGLVCYHSTTKNREASLKSILLDHGVLLSSLNQHGRGLVHRLDRGTSGCLVLAKTNRCHLMFVAHFFVRNVHKTYQALVVWRDGSTAQLPPHGTIDLAIEGRPATSQYTVQEWFGTRAARLAIRTQQGRRHQVRLHCAEGLGAPIALDSKYGGRKFMSSTSSDSSNKQWAIQQSQFCLHADTLVIEPMGIRVQSPRPAWWRDLEQELEVLE